MANTNTPWSVEEVSAEARVAAKAAAEAEGMTLGAWVSRQILEGAAAHRTEPPGDETSRDDTQSDAESEPAGKKGARKPRRQVALRLAIFALALAGAWYIAGPYSPITIGDGNNGKEIAAKSTPDAPPDAAPAAPAASVNKGPMAPFPTASDGRNGPSLELIRLRAEASKGEAKAQRDLAILYLKGKKVEKDEAEAARWLKKAALQGQASAQFYLGVLHEAGRGVSRDPKLAFSWYRRAADQNHAEAQHNLATFYGQGTGTPKNYELARQWFEKSASAGLTASQLSLGRIYEHGLGVKVDRRRAVEWYRKAASGGSDKAANRLNALAVKSAKMTADRSGPAKSLQRKGVAEIQRLLRSLNFNPGPADGHSGERTVAAIRMYQQFADLPVDGVPSARLLDDLRKVVGEMKRSAGEAAP